MQLHLTRYLLRQNDPVAHTRPRDGSHITKSDMFLLFTIVTADPLRPVKQTARLGKLDQCCQNQDRYQNTFHIICIIDWVVSQTMVGH